MMCFINSEFVSFLSVLHCEPSLKGTKELIHELNKTNGLFKFVRVMRRKFQEAMVEGTTLAFYIPVILHAQNGGTQCPGG